MKARLQGVALAILLVLAAVGGWRIYQWRLWVIQRADAAEQIYRYLAEPIEMPDGKKFTRAQLLDALVRQAVEHAEPKK